MSQNNNQFAGCNLNNQELQLVLDGIQELRHIKLIQNVASHFNDICSHVLPCAYGGIGVFNKKTNAIQWLVHIEGENGRQNNVATNGDASASNINKELVSIWLKTHRVLFVPRLVEKGLLQCFQDKSSETANMIFDGVTKEQSDKICFYWLYNIDERNFAKYQIIMRLLLLNVYEPLMTLLNKPASTKTTHNNEEISALTEREKQIICRIRGGLNNKKIARQLNISVNTVKCHIYNIFQKLQVSNRVEALLIAEQAGYLNHLN